MTPRLPPWNEAMFDIRKDGEGRLVSLEMTKVWRTYLENLTGTLENQTALSPGYAAALPDVALQPDGRLFVLTTTQTLYQVQSGAWVAVDMVP